MQALLLCSLESILYLGFPDSSGAPERLAGFYILTSSLVRRDENAGLSVAKEAGSRALEIV